MVGSRVATGWMGKIFQNFMEAGPIIADRLRIATMAMTMRVPGFRHRRMICMVVATGRFSSKTVMV
jgi:hypothetical protein